MNSPLARALQGAGINAIDVAAQLGVDPKTVSSWIAGRLPYPRHRASLVRLTGWQPQDLWPGLARPADPALRADEVRAIYPHRAAVPVDAWQHILSKAEHEISILAYSALFLAENLAATSILCSKAQAGLTVRLALGCPAGKHVTVRGEEEEIGDGMAARIRTALVGFRPAIEAGAELRLHDTILYNSIYRADNELLVNTHVYGHPGSHSPVLRIHRESGDGLAATYLDSFERVWAGAEQADAQ